MSVLLTSSDYIKSHSSLNDNTYDKFILPALERAQDLDLCEVLGECLVTSLEGKVSDSSINLPENGFYKTLLDRYVQPFLTYTTLSNIVLELGQVMGNGGIDVLTDEHRTSLTFDERGQMKDYWKHHADAYKLKMQNWLKENYNHFPELSGCSCYNGSNLRSAASTSIWLGGARGKILIDDCCNGRR